MISFPSSNDRPPAFFRGLLSAAALMALLGLVALLGALLAGSFGCATDPATGDVTITVPAAVADAATNAAARAVVVLREARERPEAPDAPEPPAPPNEWWRSFPETEEEYLALCEPAIQERLLDYPEEEREAVREALLSEASTAYLFQSVYAELMRAEENAESDVSSDAAGSDSSSTTEHAENAEGGLSVGPVDASAPSAPSVVLDFRYGGVKAKPTEDSRCRISKLRIGSDSLSFHWDSGIPSDWQRGDTKKGPMILACAFYEDGGKWIGGKFDWIDEHRSSRPLENIHGGYNGWNASAFRAARRHAFCVVSANGKFRSNLITE